MSFLGSYFGLFDGGGENPVLCPFPHQSLDGNYYLENKPSAHVNTSKLVFHCKACDRSFNEQSFIRTITGCTDYNSSRIEEAFKNKPTVLEWETLNNVLTEASHKKALDLGISEEVIKELKIRTIDKTSDSIDFPVIMYNTVVDCRRYTPGQDPKIKSNKGAVTGMIIPFDIWNTEENSKRPTLICAGEKDMAIARTHGFNAITLTGGEKTIPKFLRCFKGKNIAILYDNDMAGKEGAIKLADALYPYAKKIKVVTNFHEVCKEPGEDLTDFFTKYNGTKEQLTKYIKNTPEYEPTETKTPIVQNVPVVDLYTASQKYVNQIVQSNIQVVAVAETAYRTPTAIVAEKKKDSDDASTMAKGDKLFWELQNINCQDILYLIDGNLKEQQIKDNIRRNLIKRPSERNLVIETKEEATTYKMTVTDLYETADKNIQPMEYVAYSINNKLESGKKYFITYKLVPHPYKGQQLTMIIIDARQASDSINSFQLTNEAIRNLRQVQNLADNIPEKIKVLTEMNKHFIGYNGNNKLIEIIDLAFHTPLQFNFGRIKNIRGYLDTLIIGESRTGKSSTADALRKLYGLGTFTSLAGNSATIAGLVGGSSKGPLGTMQTRAGVIPQNHMGLIIFEEFGKSSKDVLKELTDIRSSNEVRIARVSGTTVLPALVRMIALTNVKSTGEIKSIASYPNGISIVTELVNTAEDIARYDLILVLPETGQGDIDPMWTPMKPLEEQVYHDRIRWAWTRQAEQIIIPDELQTYIIQQTNLLNKMYPSHIKLFGTEAWKKISRLAIAIAAYTVSASEDFQNIIVTKECIDYAIKIMVELYDNPTFKFKEYVEMEQRYKVTDDEAVANLQNIFNKFPSLVLQLEQQVEITRAMLESTTGLEPQEIRKALQLLVRGYFIKVDSTTISPTERFRLTIAKINKNTQIGRVGEL